MSDVFDDSNFKLAKPPIVEAWIRASFLPSEEAEPWDWERVSEFLNQFNPELDTIEALPEPPKVIKVKKSQKKTGLTFSIQTEPPEPRFFRARNADSSEVVQVGKVELLVSLMRDVSSEYGGFARLLEFFQTALVRYEEAVGSRTIQLIELHYVDVIQIPVNEDEGLDLKEHFMGIPELSGEPFGKVWQLNWSVNLIPPNSSDTSQLTIQFLPPEPNAMRFRLDWHRTCEVENSEQETVAKKLSEAHLYLKQCFRAFCLPKTWALFEPMENTQS